MKRKYVSSGLIIVTLLGSGLIPNIVNAAEVQEHKNNILNMENTGQQGVIQNIDDTIDNMIASIPPIAGFRPYLRTPVFGEDIEYSGINFKQNNVTNVVPIFIGENTFVNNSELEQTFNTTSFSESITKSTSTSIQSGFKSAITTKGKVGIPFVAEGEVSATLEFNLSSTITDTISTTTTITANSQAVKVPPNKIYKAEVYFEKKSTSGTVEIYADVFTSVRLLNDGTIYSIGSVLDMATNKYGLIKSTNDSKRVRAKGTGNFKIEHGSELIVKIYDVTAPSTKALVETKIIPIN
ncbi:ETX/MTX2 family pore-forming toxin [Lysinibacillus fusiformis]|uniref:ETX/MTX2 family pore-forming toxin n=1 Tax=Lysinibacillus fusiformis TaxID=28031 RepID=UPI000D382917|nr:MULTISPECIES: ETX/MTX2 family pore-forming toxin [Lysinibacillus]MED4669743.1 ETX/MTX2 family pore-forming toxin [Lysinibacillus fusiformis]QAS55756.1 hypothetical protein LSP_04860 [Lysinibacillus sphaericus]RDV24987.1 hypothetical protein C7B90_23055 [Lysinibacillus fusiformis]GED63995.1 hypothetical protein LFU01_24470 [Lysinibacillus fusiformis]